MQCRNDSATKSMHKRKTLYLAWNNRIEWGSSDVCDHFPGNRENKLYECGMDIFAEQIGEVGDEDFFEKNSGKGKLYPGGPTCTFQGKIVPTLTRFSPKGSITTEILVDIVGTLDHIGVFDRSEGKIPFLLLDGHGSRIQLPFLEYINNPDHL